MKISICQKYLVFFTSLILLIVFLISPIKVFAEENHFYSILNNTYTINELGQTEVKHEFLIKNLTPEYYIDSYAINLSSHEVTNVVIESNQKKINPNITHQNGTEIEIHFSDQVLGKGKIRKFTLTYQNPDLAQIAGQILEVSIPQFTNFQDFDEQYHQVVTPIKFGMPSITNIQDYQSKKNDQQLITKFDQEAKKGIVMIFGDRQIFNLQINYLLENPSDHQTITQIALPPDTLYQKMSYQQLDPLPIDIKADADGNWIATYQVAANHTLEVKLLANAMLTLKPQTNFPIHPVMPKHTQSQQYWEINNQNIQEIAQKNTTPEAVYQFVLNKLDYIQGEIIQPLERKGAVQSLLVTNQSTCQEFTDLFITLTRANQIPARRLTGFAYTQDERLRPLSLKYDILHAWPEYYDQDKKIWRAVDPTWEKTTGGVDYFNQFDLNHIVFTINGESSTLPVPPGGYSEKIIDQDQKTTEQNDNPTEQKVNPQKNIKVDFANDFPDTKADFKIEVTPKKILFFQIPGFYQLKISNPTGQAWYGNRVDFNSNQELTFNSHNNLDSVTILPFQNFETEFAIYEHNTKWLSPVIMHITINNQEESITDYEFSGFSLSNKFNEIFQLQTIIILGCAGIILTLITGSLLILRRKKKYSLRR